MKNQTVNLNLLTIKFPPMAIVSVLYRLSGVILFLSIPLFLYALSYSLHSASYFDTIKACLSSPVMKLVIWLFLAALLYHLIAGIRHLLMDIGWGETLSAGYKGSWTAIILSIIAIVFIGIWLW